MSLSNTSETTIADEISALITHVGVSTADPGEDAGSLAEPSGNAYARVAFTDWTAASSGSFENNTAVVFTEATGSWGTLTHVAFFTALTEGTMVASAALDESKAIGDGDTLRFEAGDITFTVD